MTNNITISTEHIPKDIECKIIGLDGNDVYNTLSEDTIQLIEQWKELISKILNFKAFSKQDSKWILRDENNKAIKKAEVSEIWTIYATNQKDLDTVLENIRTYKEV